MRVLIDDSSCHRHGIQRRPRSEPTRIIVATSPNLSLKVVIHALAHPQENGAESKPRDAPRRVKGTGRLKGISAEALKVFQPPNSFGVAPRWADRA